MVARSVGISLPHPVCHSDQEPDVVRVTLLIQLLDGRLRRIGRLGGADWWWLLGNIAGRRCGWRRRALTLGA